MTTLINPELAAAEVLARAEVVAPPVDPFALVKLWPELHVTVADLDGAGYLLNLEGRIGELVVRSADSTRRQRYTCAHELGHWILDRNVQTQQTMPRSANEKWCDRFAAALLMPSGWILRDLILGSIGIETISGLPGRFVVSNQAALLRVREVAPIELGIATLEKQGVVLTWTTAKGGLGRFNWIDLEWLTKRLPEVDGHALWSGRRCDVQALRQSRRRWLLAVASSRAVRSWRKAVLPGLSLG